MPNLLGTNPNQIGTNADHGSMAFQDENAVNIGGGLVQADLTGNSWNQNTDISTVQPSLRLDFDKMFSLDPRITFGRSGSPATYYDGKTVALAEQNLIIYSQDYVQGWGKNNITVATGATLAPDGTMTGSKIQSTPGSNNFFAAQVLITPNYTATYTISMFAKQSSAQQYLYFGIGDDSSSRRGHIIVDLSAGSVTSTQTSTATVNSSSVIPATNGWWRIVMSITIMPTGNGRLQFGLVDTSTAVIGTYGWYTFTATGLESAYVWGVQVENRAAVTAYTPTTSVAIMNYIPVLQTAAANQARFDFDPITGEAKGLLIEEARSNLILGSADLTTGWTLTNVTRKLAATIAPDGTLAATKLIESTAANTYHETYTSLSLTSGTMYAFSVYAKAGERSTLTVLNQATYNVQASFNLLTQVVTQLVGTSINTITPVGNGWYRCSVCVVADSTKTGYFNLDVGIGATNPSYTGDGYSGLYVWGAQVEVGTYPTSYIQTTSAQITRVADSAYLTGAAFLPWFNQGEGTVVIEVQRPVLNTNGTSQYLFNIASGSASIRVEQYQNWLYAEVRGDDASNQCDLPFFSPTVLTPIKVALAFKTNDLAVIAAGGAFSYKTPLKLGASITLSLSSNSSEYIRRLYYFPKRLPDAEIKELVA